MKTKLSSLILILLFAVTGMTCKKKIAKYPFDMHGKWYGQGDLCNKFLTIEKSGEGKIYTPEGNLCMNNSKDAKGKVKYKKDILYIDKQKYTIFDEPETITANDSIDVPLEDVGSSYYDTKRYKVLAKMTLQPKALLDFDESYTFYKIEDY